MWIQPGAFSQAETNRAIEASLGIFPPLQRSLMNPDPPTSRQRRDREFEMAFLVLGPMVDLKLIAVYTTMFRPKAIVAICGLTTLLVFALCVTGYLWMPAR